VREVVLNLIEKVKAPDFMAEILMNLTGSMAVNLSECPHADGISDYIS